MNNDTAVGDVPARSPWIEEFDKEFGWLKHPDEYWATQLISGSDYSEIKDFIQQVHDSAYKQGRERREQELYIVAELMEREGWTFDRYLRTWAKKMEVDGLIPNDTAVAGEVSSPSTPYQEGYKQGCKDVIGAIEGCSEYSSPCKCPETIKKELSGKFL